MGMDGPVYMPDGRPVLRTDALIAEGRPSWAHLSLDEMLPAAEAFYKDVLAGLPPVQARGGREIIIRGARSGWGKIRGRTPDPDKLKLLPYIDRILAEAEWVFTEPHRNAAEAARGGKVHDLLAAVQYGDRTLEVRLKVRENANGKFFYDFFNESEQRQRKTPPDQRASSVAESAKGGVVSEGAGPRAGAQRSRAVAPSPETPEIRIADESDPVNLEVRDVTPDWTPEPAGRAVPAAPTPDERAAVNRALDYEAARLLNEGAGTPEERAALENSAAELETVNREEEAALSVLECVTGAGDV
jgi:hypothetical protein